MITPNKYNSNIELDTIPLEDEEKMVLTHPTEPLAVLRQLGTPFVYHLHAGDNTIGRRSPNSDADIQIDVEGSRQISRKHISVRVDEGYCLSLYKEKVSPVFVNQVRVNYGEQMALQMGDVIQLPDYISLVLSPTD